MRKAGWHLWLIGLGLVLLTACVGNSPEIETVHLAKDKDGKEKAQVFSPEDEFFVVMDVKHAPNTTKLKIAWYDTSSDEEKFLGEQEIQSGSGRNYFSLINGPRELWALGEYQAVIYINGEQKRRLGFEVAIQAKESFLTNDANATQRTTTYASDDTVYAHIDLKGAPENAATVQAIWRAVEVPGLEEDTILHEETQPAGTGGLVSFTLNAEEGLHLGRYQVELRLNDEVLRRLNFEVAVQAQGAPYLARDAAGQEVADPPYSGEPVFVMVNIRPAPPNSAVLRVVWNALGNPIEVLGEVEVPAGTGGLVAIPLPPDVELTNRIYRANIFLNKLEIGQIRFTPQARTE
jgi:hypothetical protein